MKKNKAMRSAICMVVATLLTTCLIGGAFAKYITKAGSKTSARVAYWGFEYSSEINFDNLFADSYTHVKSCRMDESETNYEKIIAPGTEGSVDFYVGHTENEVTLPEVDYSFTIDVEGEIGDEIASNPQLQFKLDNGTYGDFATLIANLKLLSGDASGTKVYEAGTLPDMVGTTHTISWKWNFTDPSDCETQDALDTSAAGYMQGEVECSLDLNVTICQID